MEPATPAVERGDQTRAEDVVERIHSGDVDPDQHLTATGNRIGTIEELLHLGSAMPAETPRLPHLLPPPA